MRNAEASQTRYERTTNPRQYFISSSATRAIAPSAPRGRDHGGDTD
jgi:hypothetical protein